MVWHTREPWASTDLKKKKKKLISNQPLPYKSDIGGCQSTGIQQFIFTWIIFYFKPIEELKVVTLITDNLKN